MIGNMDTQHLEYAANLRRFADLAIRYRDDEDYRAVIEGGDVGETVEQLGIKVPDGMTANLFFDTPEIMHISFPQDPNVMLHDEALSAVAGGKTAGSAGTAGTASSFGCSTVPGSVSTLSTAGTAGTAG